MPSKIVLFTLGQILPQISANFVEEKTPHVKGAASLKTGTTCVSNLVSLVQWTFYGILRPSVLPLPIWFLDITKTQKNHGTTTIHMPIATQARLTDFLLLYSTLALHHNDLSKFSHIHDKEWVWVLLPLHY